MIGLSAKTISSIDDFVALKPQWDAMVDAMDAPEIFCTHDWIRVWIECFIPDERIHIITAFDGSRLVGALPLYWTKYVTLRIFIRPCLHSMSNSISARHTLISSLLDGERVFHAVSDHLKSEKNSFANIFMEHIPENSELVKFQERQTYGDWGKIHYEDEEDSYHLDITGSFEDYFQGLGKSHRQAIRQKLNLLERAGGWRCDLIPLQEREVFDRFLELEDTGWKHEKGNLIKDSKPKTEFLWRIAQAFAPKGQCLMLTIDINNIPTVMMYIIVFRGICHSIKIAVNYDLTEFKKFSPGHIAFYSVIKYCFEQNLKCFDLYGACYSYESHWTKKTSRKYDLMIFKRDDLLMKLRFALKNTVHALQKRHDRSRPGL